MQDFGDSRLARVPWLERMAFPSYMASLKYGENRGSFKLPSRMTAAAGTGTSTNKNEDSEDRELRGILNAAEVVLQDAYNLYSDTSPNRKITQQRAKFGVFTSLRWWLIAEFRRG